MTAALLAVAAVTCLAGAARPRRRPAPVELARVSTLAPHERADVRTATAPLGERLVRPLLVLVARRVRPRWAGLSEDDLRRAGVDTARFGVVDLVAAKVLLAAAGAVVTLSLSTLAGGVLVLLPLLAYAGWMAPSILVSRRRAARRRRMLRELPDLVGLLKAFVTAGIPLEQALHLISVQQTRIADPPLLAVEVRRVLGDYGLGLSIEEALAAMARRTGLEELDMLAGALSQGKRQGAGMERILRDQETVVRLAERNRAATETARVGNRLVGVLVLVYLPEFLVLIMVPLFYGIFLRAFG